MSLKLLKIRVQPVFVLEDGDGELAEKIAEPVDVAAKDWPGFPAKLEEQRQELERRLTAASNGVPS